MKVSGNALRPGNIISHQNRIWAVVSTQHTQPGKGGAYMCVILRDVRDGTKKDERFRAAEDVERLFIEEIDYGFLYQNGPEYTFMNPETYEQVTLDPILFNVSADFLQTGMVVKVGFYDNSPLFVTLPSQVVLVVEEADPVVKGQTAASSYKPARLANGMRVMVPPYIDIGVQIVVNTEDSTYVERYKEGDKVRF
jgi:elongation factor P